MLRLIEADPAASGKRYIRDRTPSRFFDFRTLDVLLREGGYFPFQVVAQEIKFVCIMVLGRVESCFCRGQGKDQPAMPRIHRFETQNVAEERAVRLSVLTVNDYMSATNHFPSPQQSSSERFAEHQTQAS